MGYDVHITRSEEWLDAESTPITLEEWSACVEADPEMRMDNAAEAVVEDSAIRYDNPGLAVWLAWPRHGKGDGMAWFDYRNGEIVVKNPDDDILNKMVAIADRLSARVFGDDGEEY